MKELNAFLFYLTSNVPVILHTYTCHLVNMIFLNFNDSLFGLY